MGKLTKKESTTLTPKNETLEAKFKRQNKLEEKVKDRLKAVFDKYGYIDEEVRKRVLGIMVMDYAMGMVMYGDDNFAMNDNLEVAKLIRIFRQCDEVVITGVIEHPQNAKERKGQTTKTKVCSKYTFFMLECFLNTLLEYQQDGFYQYEFNWEFKNDLADQYNPMIPMNFTEPFTKSELEKIIQYEIDKNIGHTKDKRTRKQKIGQRLSFIEMIMQEQGLFSTHSQGKTREYAFLFDCFVAMDRIPIPEIEMNNSEKYSYIKDCITTYKNYIKRLKDR